MTAKKPTPPPFPDGPLSDWATVTRQPTQRQIHLLRRALGVHALNKKNWGYRNRFFCDQDDANFDDWKSLVEQGLATQHGYIGTVFSFRATVAGAKAAGLHPAAIKRAFEGA